MRTAIGRPFDPSHRSNRLALAIGAVSLVAGAIVGLARAEGLDVVWEALAWAGASLLAWATARELDHDDARGATVAAVLAPLAVLAFGRPAFLAGAALLLAGRIALRSTGLIPTVLDLVVVAGLAVVAAGPIAGWVAGLVLAIAITRDGARRTDAAPWGRVFGFFAALGATVHQGIWGDGFMIGGGQPVAATVAALVAVVAMVAAPRRPPTSPCDHTDALPSGSDAFVAKLLVAAGAVIGTLLALDPGVLAPATAALVGVAVAPRLPDQP